MFRTLFNTFFEICLLQRGPQDLPVSSMLTYGLLSLLAVLGFAINQMFMPGQTAILAVIINIGVLLIITQLILRLHKKSARYTQTLTALIGVGIVLALIGLPVFSMLAIAENNQTESPFGILLWLVLFGWEIAVTAHILRHATESTFPQGILMAILYPLIYFQLVRYLIPITS